MAKTARGMRASTAIIGAPSMSRQTYEVRPAFQSLEKKSFQLAQATLAIVASASGPLDCGSCPVQADWAIRY